MWRQHTKKEQEKTSRQSQRQEKEESVSTKSSEDESYKPMTPLTVCIEARNQKDIVRSNSRAIIEKSEFKDLTQSDQQ